MENGNKNNNAELHAQHKALMIKIRGPALVVLIGLCIIGIVCCAVFMPGEDKTNIVAILFLFLLCVMLVKFLMAVSGFVEGD